MPVAEKRVNGPKVVSSFPSAAPPLSIFPYVVPWLRLRQEGPTVFFEPLEFNTPSARHTSSKEESKNFFSSSFAMSAQTKSICRGW